MGLEYQQRHGCPDLGPPERPITPIPVPGSEYEFPECPGYFVRTGSNGLDARFLVGGRHPAEIVAGAVAELEAGAVRARDLAPKVVGLARLMQSERMAAFRFAEQERKEKRAR
jgi:hypothetical protein